MTRPVCMRMLFAILIFFIPCFAYAADTAAPTTAQPASSAMVVKSNLNPEPDNAVLKRIDKENKISPRSFAIAFHRPTYVLPFYYTRSPDNGVYAGETPEHEKLKRAELKFQLSFKVPIWKNMFNYPSSLYLAYTQVSYWQAYDHDPFFRETNYEPELFVANEINFHLGKDWYLNFINVGLDHQSNGFGGTMERSWNRAIASIVFSSDHWVVVLKPWLIIKDNTYERQNPNMVNYMGNGAIMIGYKYHRQFFALESRNLLQSPRRSGNTLTWSFPLTEYLKGYVQFFSGYGQSLIEYNHRTNSFGVGVALSDWL